MTNLATSPCNTNKLIFILQYTHVLYITIQNYPFPYYFISRLSQQEEKGLYHIFFKGKYE